MICSSVYDDIISGYSDNTLNDADICILGFKYPALLYMPLKIAAVVRCASARSINVFNSHAEIR